MAPDLPLDVTIDPEKPEENIRSIISQFRPGWKDEDVKFEHTPRDVRAGILNVMITCYGTSEMKNAIMFRIRRNEKMPLDHFLNREYEVKNIVFAHSLYDFAPHVLATFSNGFCYDYIHGEVMTPASVREDRNWRIIAEQLALLHSTELQKEQKEQRHKYTQFYETLPDKYPDHLDNPEENEKFQKYFPTKAALMKETEMVLALEYVQALDCEIVLCHNDTRPENMVRNIETGKIMFVDWEASSRNPRAYEIAYHFRNYAGYEKNDFSLYPEKEYQMQWLRVYLETFNYARTQTRAVSDNDLNKLYVQVNYMYLLFLIQTVFWIGTIEDFQTINFDIMEICIKSYQEYQRIKDDILALKFP